jgi:hypothetical protein
MHSRATHKRVIDSIERPKACLTNNNKCLTQLTRSVMALHCRFVATNSALIQKSGHLIRSMHHPTAITTTPEEMDLIVMR